VHASAHIRVATRNIGSSAGARTCFQPHCNRKRCPHSPPLHHRTPARTLAAPTTSPQGEGPEAKCGFKYDDEGSSAIINAELLSLPQAHLARGAGPPARLEVHVPTRGRDGSAHPARMYFCRGCLEPRELTPTSNLSAGCLFVNYPYATHGLSEAARAVRQQHTCRLFHVPLMRRLCASFSRAADRPDHRGKTYSAQYFPWWCRPAALGLDK